MSAEVGVTFAELHEEVERANHRPLSSRDGPTASSTLGAVLHELISRVERIEAALGLPEWPLKVPRPDPVKREEPLIECTDQACQHGAAELVHYHDPQNVSGAPFLINRKVFAEALRMKAADDAELARGVGHAVDP